MERKVKVGVIGCGMISEIYMENCARRYGSVRIVACADIDMEAARKRACQFSCRYESVEALLTDPDVDLVLNLTIPAVHAEISMKALAAGKHVYSEKPFAIDIESAERLVGYAQEHNLLIGGAPDCFMGAGVQKALGLLDAGVIGKPFAVQSFLFSQGPDFFHPSPEFFYKKGGGPVFDWGPYYISALVALLGSVDTVQAHGRIPRRQRTVQCESSPAFGQSFPVEVPTYVTCVLEMECGVLVTLSMSFDMYGTYNEESLPFLRIYGLEGSLDVTDLNRYSGPSIKRVSKKGETQYPIDPAFDENMRGLGLEDMARAILFGGTYHTDARFMLHVTEVLCRIQQSAEDGKAYEIKNRCCQPAPIQY